MSASPADRPHVSLVREAGQLLSELDFSRQDLARALAVEPRTADRWFSGQAYPPQEARRRLLTLLDVCRHVRDTFTTVEAARRWFHHPHPYLGRCTPAEAVRDGRFDRVEAALEALDSGMFI